MPHHCKQYCSQGMSKVSKEETGSALCFELPHDQKYGSALEREKVRKSDSFLAMLDIPREGGCSAVYAKQGESTTNPRRAAVCYWRRQGMAHSHCDVMHQLETEKCTGAHKHILMYHIARHIAGA
jgi:hypothetical protein